MASLAELNSLFDAWLHQVYHQRVHSETDQTPLQRFLAHGAPVPVPGEILAEAFRWSEWRTVTSTAQVNLHGNLYDVDPSLVGVRVELVFDPCDLDNIDVRVHSTSYGKAIPSRLRRHVHPKAGGEPAPAPVPTGIDYLRLIQARHSHSLSSRLHYAHLDQPADPAAAAPQPRPADQTADDEASWYETDLVALAASMNPTGTDAGPGTAPDPALEAELAEFAALRTHPRSTNPDSSTDHGTDGDSDGDGDPRVVAS